MIALLDEPSTKVYGNHASPFGVWTGHFRDPAEDFTSAQDDGKLLVAFRYASEVTSNTASFTKVVSHHPNDARKLAQPAPRISTQVATIIEAFSLTISQTARVLAITRPTVYAWKKSEDSCNTERMDHQRLMKVYDLAAEWNSYNLGPMGDRNVMPFADDQKGIVGYLSSNELTPELLRKISDRMRVLAEPKEHSGLLATRGTNWREAFKKMGIAGPTTEQQDAIQDDNLSRLRHEY
jgi:DNA-binding transcriptional regulator YiaG